MDDDNVYGIGRNANGGCLGLGDDIQCKSMTIHFNSRIMLSEY